MKYQFVTIVTLFISFCINAQIVNIPDVNFKAKLLAANPTNQYAQNLSGNYFSIDSNNDGEIQLTEAHQVKLLNINSSSISNLTGIENFINLEILRCPQNNLTSLDIVQNTNLTLLDCTENNLSSLNIDSNIDLLSLSCSYNQLTNLNTTNNVNLEFINCEVNNLSSINVTQNLNLELLRFNANSITSIDVSNNQSLTELACHMNPISVLDVSQNPLLNSLECGGSFLLSNLNLSNNLNLQILTVYDTAITDLDFSNNPNLFIFYCSNSLLSTLDLNNLASLHKLLLSNNPNLETLLIRNGSNEEELELFNNPILNFICVDDFQIDTVTAMANSGALISTNCSLTIDESVYENKVTLYPNPTSSLIHIISHNTIKNIELFDVQGRIIASQISNSTHTTLDMSQQNAGIYFVKVLTENGVKVEKLIKN